MYGSCTDICCNTSLPTSTWLDPGGVRANAHARAYTRFYIHSKSRCVLRWLNCDTEFRTALWETVRIKGSFFGSFWSIWFVFFFFLLFYSCVCHARNFNELKFTVLRCCFLWLLDKRLVILSEYRLFLKTACTQLLEIYTVDFLTIPGKLIRVFLFFCFCS